MDCRPPDRPPPICLAHPARKVAYVVEIGDDLVPLRMWLWLLAKFTLAWHVTNLAAPTLAAERLSLDRQIGTIPVTPSRCDLIPSPQAKVDRALHRLLVFPDRPSVIEAFGNGSDRLPRPSVVQRKLANVDRTM